MKRKLVITKLEGKIITAVLENDEVVELHCAKQEVSNHPAELGDIYIGKVKNIVGNIGAAFVEIGKGVECYYAIEDNETPIFTHKIGKKPLCVGDELVVQVSKEAVKTKVPTVTSKLSFTGKYVVLTSGDTRIGASAKLGKEERERLTSIANQFTSDKYGFIMRTNAKDIHEDTLIGELKQLISDYEAVVMTAQTRVPFSCLKRAPRQYLRELKNIYQDGLTDIIVEDLELYDEMKDFLTQNQPEDLEKLRLYQEKLLPLHKLYGIEKQIERALKERVWMKSGAYLVIQPTEALTVIDINTGKCIDKRKDDRAYFKINIEACREVAKQIRLRNLSGIIVVDFINMNSQELTEELLKQFEHELHKDAIATTLVDMTKLQLVEVTRKKIKKPFHEAFSQ